MKKDSRLLFRNTNKISMIKRTIFCILIICNAFLMMAQNEDSLIYYNASNFEIIGKGFSNTEAPYDRLPEQLRDTLRPALWKLSKNSAGIAIRFRSNTTAIDLKWIALYVNNMSHMAATGIRGLDLYSFTNEHWQYMCTARPEGKESQVKLISNMNPTNREYMLLKNVN